MARSVTISLLVGGFLAALAGEQTPAVKPPGTAGPPPKPAPSSAAPASTPEREPGLYGVMETTMGRIVFQLFENEAPQSVRNFVELAQGRKLWFDERSNTKVRRPLYSGVTFHRVIPGFMIQTGDPTGTGAGDVGFSVPDEFHPDLRFDRPGRFGMANVGRPNTNSSQFFITEKPTPWLDGKHTVFGQVLEGQEVVNAIARVPRSAEDKPNTPVKIVRITLQRAGPRPPNAPEAPAVPAKKAAPAAKKAVAPAAKSAAPAKK